MADEKKKGFLDQIREVNAEEKRLAEEEEAKLAAERAERERAAEEAYAKKLRQEKIAIMQMKQGVIEEKPLEEKEPEKKYNFFQKIGNFFYAYKAMIIVFVAVAALAGYLVYDAVTTEKPDCTMMFTVYNSPIENKFIEAEELFSKYIPDSNGDGKQLLQVFWMGVPLEIDGGNLDVAQAAVTQLSARFQTTDTLLIIADEELAEKYELKDFLVDMTDKYPDNPNVRELGFYLKGTKFAESIGLTDDDIPDNVFVGIRAIDGNNEKAKEVYDMSEAWLDAFIEDMSK